jgi:hypothetical protein
MDKSGMFAFGTSWWEPYLKTDSKTLVDFISMSQTDQNKYNAQVKDEIIGMLMIEGCDSEGLKNHLKNEYKINGKIDCYPTTSSKAADLIDSYIEVGGNNNNKNQKTTGNDNDDEQVAGIHATDHSDDSINNDTSIPKEPPDELMNAALAAVQDGGEEDPNYYSPLEIDDIDFDSEQVAGIHVVDKDNESVEDSSSNSSSYHLSDHYYCPSDDNEYPSSSDDDESSLGSDMPGLQSREDDCSSSEDEDSTVSDNTVDDENISSVQENTLNGNTIIIDSGATNTFINDPDVSTVRNVRNIQTDSLNDQNSNGFTLDAFNLHTAVPSPLPINTVPPVSCIVIPNNQDDVNSSVATPVIERIDPSGRVPIQVQQECFVHVDDVIYNKPTLFDIGGEPTTNWTQFIETRRSFPTQVIRHHRVLQVNRAAISTTFDLPNIFLHYRPKRAGVIRGRVDPPDFH